VEEWEKTSSFPKKAMDELIRVSPNGEKGGRRFSKKSPNDAGGKGRASKPIGENSRERILGERSQGRRETVLLLEQHARYGVTSSGSEAQGRDNQVEGNRPREMKVHKEKGSNTSKNEG